MTDQQKIRRLKQAIAKLRHARNYGTAANRMIREAESELRAAVKAAYQQQAPSPEGEPMKVAS